MRKSLFHSLFIFHASLLLGCAATTTVDEYRPTADPVKLMTNENVAILGRRDAGHYETDQEFIQCIASKMRNSDINVLSEQRFVDAIYPWFEPRTAPKSLARLKRLMSAESIQRRVEELSIRYLVWLDGSTQTMDQSGSMSCAIGPGGGGCFGFTQWNKLSVYEATVWDIKDLVERGKVRVDSEGTSYLIGAVAPIPLLTPVKNDACTSMGNQLKQFFLTEGN